MLNRRRLRPGLRVAVPEQALGGGGVAQRRPVQELRVRLRRPATGLDIGANGACSWDVPWRHGAHVLRSWRAWVEVELRVAHDR